jgi:hypothetical protein
LLFYKNNFFAAKVKPSKEFFAVYLKTRDGFQWISILFVFTDWCLYQQACWCFLFSPSTIFGDNKSSNKKRLCYAFLLFYQIATLPSNARKIGGAL